MSDELRFEIAQNMQRKLVDNLKDKVLPLHIFI